MPEHTYNFDVKMHCSGCSGAVEKVLKATDGKYTHLLIYIISKHRYHPSSLISPLIRMNLTKGIKYDVSLEKQTVEVRTDDVTYETVLEKLKKTGKPVTAGKKDGVSAEI